MKEKYAEKLDYLKQAIESSDYMVCLSGRCVSEDCGCVNFRSEEDAVNSEITYGYSPEEMFNPTFFNTRTLCRVLVEKEGIRRYNITIKL